MYFLIRSGCAEVQDLYNNVTYMYPNANIWLVGHSVSCVFQIEALKLTSSSVDPSPL